MLAVHIGELYLADHAQEIADDVGKALIDAIEKAIATKAKRVDASSALSHVERKIGLGFQKALQTRAFDGRIAGVPTKAAEAGVRSATRHLASRVARDERRALPVGSCACSRRRSLNCTLSSVPATTRSGGR
jgi:hypothetical protein